METTSQALSDWTREGPIQSALHPVFSLKHKFRIWTKRNETSPIYTSVSSLNSMLCVLVTLWSCSSSWWVWRSKHTSCWKLRRFSLSSWEVPAGVQCSSVLVFSSSIRLWHISICSLKASISCAPKVFITWLLCASGPWCLSAAGEDISDTLGQEKFCDVPPKLLWDKARCDKTFFYRILILSAVLSSS